VGCRLPLWHASYHRPLQGIENCCSQLWVSYTFIRTHIWFTILFFFTVLVLTKHTNAVCRHCRICHYCGQFIYIYILKRNWDSKRRSVRVRFVVDKIALVQTFLQVLRIFPCHYSFQQCTLFIQLFIPDAMQT